jgi:hypothetical protein
LRAGDVRVEVRPTVPALARARPHNRDDPQAASKGGAMVELHHPHETPEPEPPDSDDDDFVEDSLD